MAKTTLIVDIEYNPELTDPEGLASAMDRLIETALSTPGIMEEYGNPRVDEFFVAADGSRPKPGLTVVVEIAGGVLQEAYSSDPAVQLVLVDWDTEGSMPDNDAGIVEITDEDGQTELAHVAEYPTVSIDQLTGTNAGRALERAGIAIRSESAAEPEVQRRWVLFNPDTNALLTTQVYTSYEEAADDASRVNDVLVLPLVWQEVIT